VSLRLRELIAGVHDQRFDTTVVTKKCNQNESRLRGEYSDPEQR
jgi:hypothetical protein